jgi:NADPH2:quinone reductase
LDGFNEPRDTRALFRSGSASSGSVDPLNVGLLAQKGSLYVTRPTLNTHPPSAKNLAAMANEPFEVVKPAAVKIEVHRTYPLKDAAKVPAARDRRF